MKQAAAITTRLRIGSGIDYGRTFVARLPYRASPDSVGKLTYRTRRDELVLGKERWVDFIQPGIP